MSQQSSNTPSTPVESKSMGVEDTIEFLADEKESPDTIELEKPSKKAGEGEEEPADTPEETEEGEKEEVDELAEIEAELEGPSEEKLELVTPVRRQEILKKYPNLFKDFPYLQSAYYRDQQFTEMFGTVKDAQVINEKAETLDRFENEIMSGNIHNVLRAVHSENRNGFYKIVDKYLISLAEVDESAYRHVLSNVGKHTIQSMVREAKRSNSDVLQSAAQILNQFLFGSSDFTHPTNLSREDQQETEQSEAQSKRELEFVRGQYESAKDDMDTRVNNTIRNTIEANIDPRKSMHDYVRTKATEDALNTLGNLLAKDTRFRALTDKLWERSFQDNFSKESQERIRTAFLSRAKTLLPSVIKKARNDALKGTGHRVREMDEESTPNKGPVSAGKPRSQSPGKIRNAKDIPRGMSTLDFLNSD